MPQDDPWSDAVVFVDAAGVVIGANPSAEALAARPLLGTGLVELLPEARAGRATVAGVDVDVVVSSLMLASGVARTFVMRRLDDVDSEAARQLAARVGHGLRDPLGAVRNAWFYVARRVRDAQVSRDDPRVPQCLDIVDVELQRCALLVSELFEIAEIAEIAEIGPGPQVSVADDAAPSAVEPAHEVPTARPSSSSTKK
ncbi:MAG: hypothetical protein Q8O67_07045 [Deltaproteobacteria bacterium]|nr:hypothetical protein [Deltaproteobacteria bacterium]